MLTQLFISYSKDVNFWAITDNDGMTNCSYLTYNSLDLKTNKIKVLSNQTLYPNELSSLTYYEGKLFTIDDGTKLLYQIKNNNGAGELTI